MMKVFFFIIVCLIMLFNMKASNSNDFSVLLGLFSVLWYVVGMFAQLWDDCNEECADNGYATETFYSSIISNENSYIEIKPIRRKYDR